MPTLFLCGAGNAEGVRLALSVHRERGPWERIVLLDDDPQKIGRAILGVEIAGAFDELAHADPARDFVANLVARTTRGRAAARDRILAHGIPFAALVHPGIDTLGVELPADVMAYPQAILGPESSVAEGTVVLMGAMVGHESRVGPGCVIAANAVLNARVELGRGVYVGTNATILPEITVGDWATIGAGSAVIGHVPKHATVMGVPAETLMIARAAEEVPFESPGDDTEEAIATIWRDTLEIVRVGIHDDFFRLGGDSLRMLEIQAGIQRSFGVDIPPRVFFQAPTIAGIARLVEEQVLGAADEGVVHAFLREVDEC